MTTQLNSARDQNETSGAEHAARWCFAGILNNIMNPGTRLVETGKRGSDKTAACQPQKCRDEKTATTAPSQTNDLPKLLGSS